MAAIMEYHHTSSIPVPPQAVTREQEQPKSRRKPAKRVSEDYRDAELQRAKTRAYIDAAIIAVFWFYLIVGAGATVGILAAGFIMLSWPTLIQLPLKRVEVMEKDIEEERQQEWIAEQQRIIQAKQAAELKAEQDRKKAEQKRQEEIYRTLQSNWTIMDIDDSTAGDKSKDW